MKKRFIIPLIIIFSVILSICVSAQPSQADTPLENSESYTDVSVQESANQLYESLMSAFNSANGKNSSTPSQLSYPDAYGGAYIQYIHPDLETPVVFRVRALVLFLTSTISP